MAVPCSILVTGANRGIGFELVRQLVASSRQCPEYVLATHRSALGGEATTALEALAKQHACLHLIQLDVTDESAVQRSAQDVGRIVGEGGLSVLVNNAATLTETTHLCDVSCAEMMRHYQVNTVGPVLVTQAMLPLLELAATRNSNLAKGWARAAIFHISSFSGSITFDEPDWRMYSYKASKAALNMLGKMMSEEVAAHNVVVQMLCPGWVRTDMGGPTATLSVQQSAEGLLAVMENMEESRTGSFMNYRGDKLAW